MKPDPKPEPRKKNKRRRIPYISKARQADLKIYAVARDQYLKDNPMCERCKIERSDQIHHKKGKVGSMLYNKTYFMAVCFECHRYIEDNPNESKQKGWSLNRLT